MSMAFARQKWHYVRRGLALAYCGGLSKARAEYENERLGFVQVMMEA
jgi:hypothetical protein